MHPMKAKALDKVAEISRIQDASLQGGLRVATNPQTYGWIGSLVAAAVMLPLTGLSAVITDVSQVMIARSSAETWERVARASAKEE
ncbi:MAG TPA: hypothetical protein VFU01_18760 [Gemmatimonadaceae bacterium]|nr:hypothetical protein [Gemmatimonadaceae bacterium]